MMLKARIMDEARVAPQEWRAISSEEARLRGVLEDIDFFF